MINITKEEIINILDNHPYFEILSEYRALRKPIIKKCKTCGDIRESLARTLIEKDKNGNFRNCVVCTAREKAISKRKSHDQFINELNKINPNIEVLTEYTKNDIKVKCKCLIDNYIWEVMPHQLLGGHGCPKCANRLQNRRSHDEYIQEMKLKHPNIIVLDEFKKVNEKIHFRCSICNYEWCAVSNALLNKSNSGCPKCLKHIRVSEEDYMNRIKNNEYVEYVDGYVDMSHHANFRCKKCGNVWDTLPASIAKGTRCPKCSISHGELEISKTLDNLNIKYIQEYKFDKCKDIRHLRFDFYLPEYNTCIEYDGEQHFMPVKYGSSVKRGNPEKIYEETKRRDKIKTDFCKNNNINLIRIPYMDFNNISEIINKHFS